MCFEISKQTKKRDGEKPLDSALKQLKGIESRAWNKHEGEWKIIGENLNCNVLLRDKKINLKTRWI